MPRTRAHIEGDLAAATRQVEKLQAELAATPPARLVVDNVIRSGKLELAVSSGGGLQTYSSHNHNGQRILNIIDGDDVPAIRDWLVYHFPQEG